MRGNVPSRGLALAVLLMMVTAGGLSAVPPAEEGDFGAGGAIPLRDVGSGIRIAQSSKAGERIGGEMGQSILGANAASMLATDSILSEPFGDAGSGWIDDVLVSDQLWNANNDGFQSMETDPVNGDLYMVYETWTNYATGTFQWCLVCRRSQDGGATWSSEIWVFAYTTQINGVYPDMKEPDIAIGPDGAIWLVYTVFAYNGPARTVIDMQIFAQTLSIYSWASGPWSGYMVSDAMGTYYNYHRLPSVAIDQGTYQPIIATMTYNAISATYSSVVAWQYAGSPSVQPWDGWLVDGPVNANYIQYPCIDTGASGIYITAMYYYASGGVFDMVVYSSTNGGFDWTMVGDFYDSGNVNSFYKPTIASTKSGTDIVLCAGTYTPAPSDQHQGQIGYAFSLDSGATWSGYVMTMSNYQRMTYVEPTFAGDYFGMAYRQENGGPTYQVCYIYASSSNLASWYGPSVASDSAAVPASNWFPHLAYQNREDGYDYACIAWSDLRGAADPITENSDTGVVYSTEGSRVTIDSSPISLNLYVDSQYIGAPVLYNWPAGMQHQLEAPAAQSMMGTDYAFDRWSDGGAIAHVYWSGIIDETVTAYYIAQQQFSIPLVQGWNLVSLPLIQADEGLDHGLSSIAGQWDYIMVYDRRYPEPWRTNYTGRPWTMDDLASLNHSVGFWINITAPSATLVVHGSLPASTTISINAGWNLIGYPAQADSSYTVNMLKMATGVDIVEGFNIANEYRMSPLMPGVVLKRGQGYWVHTPVDTVWTVNW